MIHNTTTHVPIRAPLLLIVLPCRCQVYFYHAQAGGCCDCGDPDAWAPEGFCSVHGKHVADPLASLEPTMVARARVVLRQVAASLVAAADG